MNLIVYYLYRKPAYREVKGVVSVSESGDNFVVSWLRGTDSGLDYIPKADVFWMRLADNDKPAK